MKANMNNFWAWIQFEDEDKLKVELEKKLETSGFHVLNKCEHYFEPYGYTGLWLLSESHFAIHSFPEEEKIYIELTSCVDEPFEKMKKYILNNKNVLLK
ncbi:MAG: S-adenosylmethionine decarboxylase [Clostridia bacterium]|nr:S-adenosylmethionine decarboxylase [Clostridia bacterium]